MDSFVLKKGVIYRVIYLTAYTDHNALNLNIPSDHRRFVRAFESDRDPTEGP